MKRFKIPFVFMLLGTLFVFQMSGNAATSATKATQDASGNNIASTYIKNISVDGTKLTIAKGDGTTSEIATQDTTYTAGSNISIDASNQISAVLPVIKVDSSTGAITDSSGKSIEAKVFSFATSALIGTLSTLSGQNAGTYLVYDDGYIPKVVTATSNKSGKYSFS